MKATILSATTLVFLSFFLSYCGIPQYFEELNFEGLDFTQEQFDRLMGVSREEFRQELLSEADLYLDLYDHLPKELIFTRELLAGRM